MPALSFQRRLESSSFRSRYTLVKKYYIYILASQRNGTLYIGFTGNLKQRMEQHKNLAVPGFTRKYKVTQLVYYQEFNDVRDAISAEKKLKVWQRAWKIRLIEEMNPNWDDISALPWFGLL